MNTHLGYSKQTLTDSNVLLSAGGHKALSEFIGSLTWDSTNKKIKYTPVGGTATDLVTLSWSNISGKPSTFAPSAHTHAATIYQDTRDTVITPTGAAAYDGLRIDFKTKSVSGITSSGAWTAVVTMDGYADVTGGYPSQLGFSMSDLGEGRRLYFRSPKSATEWGAWNTLAFTSDIPDVSGFITSTTLANYLPLSGGTMTGTINSQNILPKTTGTYNLGTGTYRYSAVCSNFLNAGNSSHNTNYGPTYIESTSNWFSLLGPSNSTANSAQVTTLAIGNSNDITTSNPHQEGRLALYSAGSGHHTLHGTTTNSPKNYWHALPNVGDSSGNSRLVAVPGYTAVGSSSTPVYINANGEAVTCNNLAADYLKAVDKRDVLPNSTGIVDKYGIKPFFVSSSNFTRDYTDRSLNYFGDLLVLDSFVNGSGGKVNALLFDKHPKTNNIWHFSSDYNSDSWGTGRRLAYSDEVLEAPGVKYDPIFNTLYKYTAEYTKENATNADWLVRIDLANNWNNSMCELVVHPMYNNICGALKISRNDEIMVSQYNGNNALEYFGHWLNGDGIHIYLKLAKNTISWNNETNGYVKVYATYPITITEISELPSGITLKPIGNKYGTNEARISKAFLSEGGISASRVVPNASGLSSYRSSLGRFDAHWNKLYVDKITSDSGGWDDANILTVPKKNGTLATLDDIPNAANFVLKSGDTMYGALTISSGDFRSGTLGLNIGSAHIGSVTSTSDMVIANSNIRFTKNNVYDWNQWAGLTYDSNSKTIKLGIADGTHFYANSAQKDGNILLPGIKELKLENTTAAPQSLKFHSTPSNDLDWTSEIAADYWGNNYNTTTGWTRGMYFVSGRLSFDNFMFLANDKTPIGKIANGGFYASNTTASSVWKYGYNGISSDNQTWFSLLGLTSTTVNLSKQTVLAIGNSGDVATTTAHNEGVIALYSAGTQSHVISGVKTSTGYNHYLPNANGYFLQKSSTGAVGSASLPVYFDSNGLAQTCYPIQSYKYLYHDIAAFCTSMTPTYSTSSNGVDFMEDVLNKELFSAKESAITRILTSTTKAVRWEWDTGAAYLGCNFIDCIAIGWGYSSPAPSVTVKLEFYNGSKWRTGLLVENHNPGAEPVFYNLTSGESCDNKIRLTISTYSGSGDRYISSIKLLTKRWGNQGLGSEYEKPYKTEWVNANLANLSILPWSDNTTYLGTSANRWAGIYGYHLIALLDVTTPTLLLNGSGTSYLKASSTNLYVLGNSTGAASKILNIYIKVDNLLPMSPNVASASNYATSVDPLSNIGSTSYPWNNIFVKGIVVGASGSGALSRTTTISRGSNTSNVSLTLPTTSGTLALTSQIPSLPSNNALITSTVAGATLVTVSEGSTNGNYFLTFAESTRDLPKLLSIYTNSRIKYNPSTDTLETGRVHAHAYTYNNDPELAALVAYNSYDSGDLPDLIYTSMRPRIGFVYYDNHVDDRYRGLIVMTKDGFYFYKGDSDSERANIYAKDIYSYQDSAYKKVLHEGNTSITDTTITINGVSKPFVKSLSTFTAVGGANIGNVGTPTVSYNNGTFTFNYLKGATGALGPQGTLNLIVSTAPTSYTTTTNGFAPKFRIAASTVTSQSGITPRAGDSIIYGGYAYTIGTIYNSYCYLGPASLYKGDSGDTASGAVDKVKLANSTTSSDIYPVLFKYTNTTTDDTNYTRFTSKLTYSTLTNCLSVESVSNSLASIAVTGKHNSSLIDLISIGTYGLRTTTFGASDYTQHTLSIADLSTLIDVWHVGEDTIAFTGTTRMGLSVLYINNNATEYLSPGIALLAYDDSNSAGFSILDADILIATTAGDVSIESYHDFLLLNNTRIYATLIIDL